MINDIIYTYDVIMVMISYLISYHNIPGGSMILSGSAAAFRVSAPRGSGLAATLPRLCGPDPALAETLSPDPLRLRDGHHPIAAPAIEPHPDIHFVEPATVAPVALCICLGISKARIVPEAVWNCRVTVAADEARNEGGARPRAQVRWPRGRCRGRAGVGCWPSHRASWVRQLAA